MVYQDRTSARGHSPRLPNQAVKTMPAEKRMNGKISRTGGCRMSRTAVARAIKRYVEDLRKVEPKMSLDISLSSVYDPAARMSRRLVRADQNALNGMVAPPLERVLE